MACTCSPKSSKMCDSCLRTAQPKVIGGNVKLNGEFTLNQVDEFQRQFEANIVADIENNPLTKMVKQYGNKFYESLNTVNTDFLQRPHIVDQLPKFEVLSERLKHGPISSIEFAAFLVDSNYTPVSAVDGPTGCNADGPKFCRELDNYYNGDFSDSVLGGFCSLFGNIFGAIGGFFDILGKVGALISDALEFIAKIRNIKNPLKALFDAIKVKALIEAIKEKIAKMIEKTIEKVKDMIKNFNPAEIMQNVVTAIETKVLGKINKIKNDIMLFFSEENIKRIKDKIKGIIDYCIGLFDNPSLEEIQFLIARICAFATGIEGLVKGLKSPLDDFSNRYQEVFNTLQNSGNRITGAAIQAGAIRFAPVERREIGDRQAQDWGDVDDGRRRADPGVPGHVVPPRPEELAQLPTFEEVLAGTQWIKIPPGAKYLTRATAQPAHECWTELNDTIKILTKRMWFKANAEGIIRGHFWMNSGYRSPRDNAFLRSRSPNVAKDSQHKDGNAIDLSWSGPRSDWPRMRQIAREVGFTGIGTYSGDGFIHFDRGPVRTWGS